MKFATLVFAVALLAGCQRTPAPKPVQEFHLKGEVTAIDDKAQTATVKHEKIEGWMEAMTMEYQVKDKQEFQKLKVGDQIQAKVDVQGTDYWIAAVTEDAPTKAESK